MSLPKEISDMTNYAISAERRGRPAERNRYTTLVIALARIVKAMQLPKAGPGEYLTTAGHRFCDFYDGPSPLELFDAGRWAECAHACVFMIYRTGDAALALRCLEDDCVIHELLHLACGVPVCTHNGMDGVRAQVAAITPPNLQAA